KAMMLRNFVFLDEKQLDQYIAQVEDGLRQIRRHTANSESSRSGGGDLKVVKGELGHSEGTTETAEFSDSAPARFNRLLDLVDGHEEEFGWIEVLQAADLEGVRPTSIVDVTADLYETDITKITGPNGLMRLLPLISKMQGAFASWRSAS